MVSKSKTTNIIITIGILALLVSVIEVNAATNECAPECGKGPNACADYKEATSSSSKCYSCAAGYVGGSGKVDGKGASCAKGSCPNGCAACLNQTDSNKCYICTYNFYDPTGDTTKATPCVACHSDCLSCAGNTANDCLVCQNGHFDNLNSPYTKGSCSKCDSGCSYCQSEATNCLGCCADGFGFSSKTSNTCHVGCPNSSGVVVVEEGNTNVIYGKIIKIGLIQMVIVCFMLFLS